MIHTHYLMCTKVSFCLKSSQNKKDLNDVTAVPFSVSFSQHPTNEFFLRISALALKMRLKQKLYNNKFVKQPLFSTIKCLHFFDLTSFQRLGLKFFKKICCFFGRKDILKLADLYIVLIELTSNLVIIKRTLSAILECCLGVIRKSSSKAGSLAASFISKVFLLRTFHGRIHDSF